MLAGLLSNQASHFKNMALLLFILLLLGGVSSSEESGAMIKSVTESTNITDILSLNISRHFPPCSSSNSKCVIKCSTHAVKEATLTWYKENQEYSRLTVFDLDPNPSLPLYVDHQDKNTYRCVLSSPISNQTEYANITQLCQTCSDTTQTMRPVKEGGDVTLHTDLKDIKPIHILWRYYGTLVAEIFDNQNHLYDCVDGKFRNKLQLNSQTGALTITNTSKKHSGIYNLEVIDESLTCWSYNVTVIEPLPSPHISSHSDRCPSSGLKCALECSVFNVTDGNLTWYRGNSSVSSISLRDGNYSCLYLNNTQDEGNYSCVVSNSFINETKYLKISELCSDQRLAEVFVLGFGPSLVILVALGVGHYCCKCIRTIQERAGSQNSPKDASRKSTGSSSASVLQPLLASSSDTEMLSQDIPL